jgi:hypothetical protein
MRVWTLPLTRGASFTVRGLLTPSRTAVRITCTRRSTPVEYSLVPQEQAVDPEGTLGKAETLIERENLIALNDSGVVCKFSRDYMTPER